MTPARDDDPRARSTDSDLVAAYRERTQVLREALELARAVIAAKAAGGGGAASLLAKLTGRG